MYSIWNSPNDLSNIVIVLDYAGVCDIVAGLVLLVVWLRNKESSDRKLGLWGILVSILAGVLWVADAKFGHGLAEIERRASNATFSGLEAQYNAATNELFEMQQSESYLEMALYPRHISDRLAVSKRLSAFAGTNVIILSAEDEDSRKTKAEIEWMLKDAKWSVASLTNALDRPNNGAGVTTRFVLRSNYLGFDQSAGEALASELNRSKVLTRHLRLPASGQEYPEGILLINVGPRPTPLEELEIQSDFTRAPEARSNLLRRFKEHAE